MADPFTLGRTTEQVITFTLTADQRPYVEGLYLAQKREGETIEAFVRRLLITEALRWRAAHLVYTATEEKDISLDAERDQIHQDHTSETARILR